MKAWFYAVAISGLLFTKPGFAKCDVQEEFAVILHGGAGGWGINEAEREAYTATVRDILTTAQGQLKQGEAALTVVETIVTKMEDSPLFNAGKGAVATSVGTYELDAAVMKGSDLSSGAVAAVKTIKNPIAAARAVMEQTPHVLLAGHGADQFAAQVGLETVPQNYFEVGPAYSEYKYGTVGAVALDRCGELVAGTSTGGLRGKMPGRVGDTPIAGAGTFANHQVAVSGTGQGEYFIRLSIARTIAALYEYQTLGLDEAAKEVVHQQLANLGGSGGVIALAHNGEIAATHNTPGMLFGYAKGEEAVRIQFSAE